MPIETAHSLIDALRTCGLFPPKELEGILRELTSLGDDASTLMRHLLHREWLTLYQLRKVVHGKGAELRIGAYVLTEKVGEGGMGKVYRRGEQTMARSSLSRSSGPFFWPTR